MPTQNIKAGPMACTKANMRHYRIELMRNKIDCNSMLEIYKMQPPEVIWRKGDGAGKPPAEEEQARALKLVTTVTLQDGMPTFPPRYTRLSDELVYLATKFLKGTERGRDYPYDFLPRGDIRPERVPSGVGPIVWAHGLPFFPVYKGYYILCGRQHISWYGWLLHQKSFSVMKSYPTWTIGPVIAPGSAVALKRSIERQLCVHEPVTAKGIEKGWGKNPVTRDVVSALHHQGSIVPRTSDGGFEISPLYRIQGYHIRCGPNSEDGTRATMVGRSFFTENRLTDFDWDAAVKRPYANERRPRAYWDDDDGNDDTEDMDEDEDDADDEEEEDGSGAETEDEDEEGDEESHNDDDDDDDDDEDDDEEMEDEGASEVDV